MLKTGHKPLHNLTPAHPLCLISWNSCHHSAPAKLVLSVSWCTLFYLRTDYFSPALDPTFLNLMPDRPGRSHHPFYHQWVLLLLSTFLKLPFFLVPKPGSMERKRKVPVQQLCHTLNPEHHCRYICASDLKGRPFSSSNNFWPLTKRAQNQSLWQKCKSMHMVGRSLPISSSFYFPQMNFPTESTSWICVWNKSFYAYEWSSIFSGD